MSLSDGKSSLTERQERLVAYWKSKRADGRWPSRKDINPGEVLNALASISLVERSSDGFRFRLKGSKLRSVFGGDLTGQFINKIDNQVAEAGSASMSVALETGHPVSGSRKVRGQWHIWLRLPLLDEAGNPTLVLCADEVVNADPDAQITPAFAQRTYGAAA